MSEVKYRKPSRFWTGVPTIVAWPWIKLKHNIHVDKKKIKGIKGPFILIANHGANIDPVYMYCSLFPRLINFVGGYVYFKNPFLNWYFKKLGSIAKFQYQTDLNAMREMLAVTKNNGILGIFPAGRLPSAGEGFPIPESLSKLIKLARVPVVVCKIDGASLDRPKWAHNTRRGRIDLTYYPLFSKDEVKELSYEDMTKRINEELYFNDYLWNLDKRYNFGKNKLAEGLETILYRCPKCGKEYQMVSNNNTLTCKSCNYSIEINPVGEFINCKEFKTPYHYFEWQRESVRELIEDENFIIEDESDVVVSRVYSPIEKYGHGKVSIDFNNIKFIGKIDNIDKEVIFPLDELFSLPYKAGENFEVADGNDIYKFKLKNGLSCAKYSLIVEELYRKKNNGRLA